MSTFTPQFLAQQDCGALIPNQPGIEVQCGEPSTCWLPVAPHKHPRCDAHKNWVPGVNLTNQRCLAVLLRQVSRGT